MIMRHVDESSSYIGSFNSPSSAVRVILPEEFHRPFSLWLFIDVNRRLFNF
jgi:hypothetical protein